jgi:L-lactate dehydrogenase complex protein LldG
MVEGTSMSDGESILTRIGEALSTNRRGDGDGNGLPTTPEIRKVMPLVGSTFQEQLELFKRNAADLRVDFQCVADTDELLSRLRRLCQTEHWNRIASHDGDLTTSIVPALELPFLLTNRPFEKQDLAQCEAGISECDALVAQTGSVLLTSRSAGGRALSCLPPHHIVLARREQMVPDLSAAFELLSRKYPVNYPSMISFITGPSRTGDIERILVLGAHGPKRLTVFMV